MAYLQCGETVLLVKRTGLLGFGEEFCTGLGRLGPDNRLGSAGGWGKRQ